MLSPMIVFSSVTKEYHGRPVVKDVSFTVQPGEFVCITGPSGAGKSTLIHLLIRAEYPTSGTIEVDGADIAKLPVTVLQMYRRNMGVVFQDYKLLEDRTVAENIAFALEVSGESDQVILERLEEVLSDLKLTEQAQMFPAELSGGEKTRTALARALVHQPSILVTDEPTGNIDPVQSLEIIKLLKQVNARGTTVILASHDKLVVDAIHARVLRLEHGSLIRDSVGGYLEGEETKETQPTAVKTESHSHPHPHPHTHPHPHQHKEGESSGEHHKHGGVSGRVKPISI